MSPAVGLLVVIAAMVAVVIELSSSSPSRRATASRTTPGRSAGSAGTGAGSAGNPGRGGKSGNAGVPGTTTHTAGSPGAHATLAAAQWAAVRRLARQGLPLYCGGSVRRMVALTFDDGPGPYTHYAIAKLRAAHARATFFLVGKEVTDWPGWAQREKAVAAFGDHTMTHPSLPSLPRAAAFAQITDAQHLIERAVHEPVLLFRPPYEAHTRVIDLELRRLHMVEVLWNVDSTDSLGGNYRTIEQRVTAGLHPGSIILMHENHGPTIRALNTILTALRRRHLRAVTVPQLIAQDPPSLAQLRRGWEGCAAHVGKGNGG
jgi:peptidoglycan/xylan/chitin deacetylase (PgdA/CDA1 family)